MRTTSCSPSNAAALQASTALGEQTRPDETSLGAGVRTALPSCDTTDGSALIGNDSSKSPWIALKARISGSRRVARRGRLLGEELVDPLGDAQQRCVAAAWADQLHADRHSGGTGETRDVHTRQMKQRPEMIEHRATRRSEADRCLAGRAQGEDRIVSGEDRVLDEPPALDG